MNAYEVRNLFSIDRLVLFSIFYNQGFDGGHVVGAGSG